MSESDSLVQLWFAASEDPQTAFQGILTDQSQYHRRTFIRAAYTTIEAFTSMLKQSTLARGDLNALYSLEELAVLKEETYSVDGKGTAHVQPRFIPTVPNLLFALAMYFRPLVPEFKLDTTAPAWASLLRGLKVRNRLTHPKRSEDLEISIDDVTDALAGYKWIEHTWVRAMVTMARSRQGLSPRDLEMLEIIEKRLNAFPPALDRNAEQRERDITPLTADGSS